MIIALHVLIALSSIILTGITSFSPSKLKLTLSYVLVGMTIASGTYLIITMPAHMISTCFEGLLYIGVVTVGLIFAQRKLAVNSNN